MTKNDFADGQAQCAWCGSSRTYFKIFICWDEDERGNSYETTDLNDPDHAPCEALWFCASCGDDFIEPLPGEEYPTLPIDFVIPIEAEMTDDMSDKQALEIIERVMTDREPITFSINIMEVYLLISHLQLAYRHPGIGKVMRGHSRHIADQMAQAVTDRHPEAKPIMDKGWDPQFDREQGSLTASEKEWIEGKKRSRK